jgi:hypothetical protein
MALNVGLSTSFDKCSKTGKEYGIKQGITKADATNIET